MLAVILKFDDEEAALGFADLNHGEVGEVVGIYKVPTLFCEGPHPSAKKTQVGFTQGQRWGWWVCAYCMKPKKTAYLHLWKYMSLLGFNLIDKFVQEGKLVAFSKREAI